MAMQEATTTEVVGPDTTTETPVNQETTDTATTTNSESLEEYNQPTADITSPFGVSQERDDGNPTDADPELQTSPTPNEQTETPIAQIIAELKAADIFDPTTLDMIGRKAQAEGETALTTDEIAELRQVYRTHLHTQEILNNMSDPDKARLKELQVQLKDLKGPELDEAKAELAQIMNSSFEGGAEKIDEWATALLAIGTTVGEGFVNWLTEGIQDSDLTLLIDAIMMGADFNATGRMSSAYEAEGVTQIDSKAFFKQLVNNPQDSIDKLLAIENDLAQKINWKQSEILRKEKGKSPAKQRQALQAYFLDMYHTIASSSAQRVMWERASTLIAKELFGEKAVISLEVYEDLKRLSKDEQAAHRTFSPT